MLQRRLRLGYTRAGRLIDMLERRGIISGYEGSKPRQVLITEADVPRILSHLAEADSGAVVGRRAGAAVRRTSAEPATPSGRLRPHVARLQCAGPPAAIRARLRSVHAISGSFDWPTVGSLRRRWLTSARRCARRGCAPGST